MKKCVLGILLAASGLLLAEDGFVSIFDGKTLQGWREDPKREASAWEVKDGVIRGEGKENQLAYLIYAGDEKLGDFEFKFSYRMVTKGNSGVEVRGRTDKTGKRRFEGYHADIGHIGIGDGILGAWDFHFGKGTRKEFPCPRGVSLVIDEKGEGKSSPIEGATAVREIRERDWNDCRIVAKGNHLQFWINGKLASEFRDGFKGRQLTSGFLGLQLHDKGMVVEFKDLWLKKG
ncbi:MAG: 3-keto-disaccharide hydrolase [Akkermansiaceae bacterium]